MATDTDPDPGLDLEPPLDLAALRLQLGEALFAARLAEAEEREALLIRIEDAMTKRGLSFLAALRACAPEARPDTIRRWYERWRREGLAGLVSRQRGRAGKHAGEHTREHARRYTTASTPAALQLELGLTAAAPGDMAAFRALGLIGHRPTGLLKLPGSKRSLVPQLLALVPRRFATYHEPFVGTAALFLALRPARAFLSDHNAEFVNLYTVVRDAPEALIEALARHVNTRDHYYTVRGLRPEGLAPVERAARTMFLNRTCFNGLYRVNRHGLFNVPYGRQTHTTFFHPDIIRRVHTAVRGATIACADFEACAEHARPDDFVYLDPPYAKGKGDGRNFRYQAGGFDDAAQARVADLMRRLDRRGCLVMASNADCPLTRELYRGFRIDALSVHRKVGAEASSRGSAAEIVVRNYDASRPTLL